MKVFRFAVVFWKIDYCEIQDYFVRKSITEIDHRVFRTLWNFGLIYCLNKFGINNRFNKFKFCSVVQVRCLSLSNVYQVFC